MTDRMSDNEINVSFELMQMTNALHDAYERERQTRVALLRLHGWMGLAVGLLIYCCGTASLFESDFGLWTRPVMGTLAFASGAILLVGLRRPRGKHGLEILGLALIGLWDFLMALAIVALVITYDQPWVFPTPGHPELPPDQPRVYAVVVYLVLSLMVWGVHLRAVLTDRKQSRV